MEEQTQKNESRPETISSVTGDKAVIAGSVSQPLRSKFSPKVVLLLAISAFIFVSAVVFAGVLIYNKTHKNNDAGKVAIDKPLEQQTPDEVKTTLSANTGLDVTKLQNSNITDKTYKSSEQAYQAAQALNAVGAYDKAITSYAIASTTSQDYTFYLNYSAAADSANNTKLGSELLQKARDVLQADASVDAQKKQLLLDELDQKIKFRKLNNI